MAMPTASVPRAAFVHIFDEEVSVDDPIGVHTDESHAVMLQRLTSLYAMRCYKGCFIISIQSIVDMQPAEIGYESNLGYGQIRVQFAAQTLKYVDGDVVAGVEVAHKSNGMIAAKLVIDGVTRLFVNLRENSQTESIVSGQRIIVRLRRLAYPYGGEMIVANGELYMPDPITRIYDTGASAYVATIEAENMLALLARLRAELAAAPDWQRIHDALSPWRKAPATPHGATVADLAPIAAADCRLPPYIARDSRIGDRARVLTFADPVFPGDYEIIQGLEPECAIIEIIRAEIEYIITLLDCADAYAGAAFDAHQNMWTVISSAKV